ncbi:prephenate dehydrogenase/arogenate dehydrogenase family protein [Streptomyces achromogenes]|uniref:prephenate dehydrogenase/arogenate dehydrogenase family protein n=1 Tax=Streptomyces achromogenes TaxID=67255 RepID=UPI00068CFE90|nr:prephenate dehydrogenase/arogenate dehydrogenase family protein [Streptomyces achromogenes]
MPTEGDATMSTGGEPPRDPGPAAGRLARAVVVGGGGAVGHMFTERLAASGLAVTSVDIAPADRPPVAGVHRITGDVTSPAPPVRDAVATADLVVLAVPEKVVLAAVRPLAALLRKDAVLADTTSVKGAVVARTRDALAEVPGGGGIEAVSLNPMYAPSLGPDGRPVAVVRLKDGPGVRALLGLMESWGARIVPVGAREHDRLMAAAQAATHAAVLAFGLSLKHLGVGITELSALAPPPHTAMLALLARITSAAPEVYWDVQTGSADAGRARAALKDGVGTLIELADTGDEAAFAATLAELRAYLGADAPRLADLCARMFRHTGRPA